MITEFKLLEIVTDVLNEINEISFNKDCEIISGTKDVWNPTSKNIFETSFVERIVKKLTYYEKKIGWEVSYPYDVEGYHNWSRSKLDFAFNFIDKYLFETVIEVKTWNGKDEYLYKLWSDIFKLYGYKSSEYKDAGQNKYLLVFYKAETDTSADIITKIDETFVNIKNIKNQIFSEELFRKYLQKADWFDESISQLYTDIKDKLINVPFICFDEKKYLVHDKSNRNYAFLLKLYK